MQKHRVGNTNFEVVLLVLGFGAMTIGGAFSAVDDNESVSALHAAIDASMNFIDTSNAYGEGYSEPLIGQFLAERSDRDDILVLSKGSNNLATRQHNFEPDYIQTCLGENVARLGRAIDFYMLHNPNVDNMSAEDSYEVLVLAQQAGKIRHRGVSVNNLAECELAVNQRPRRRHADRIQLDEPGREPGIGAGHTRRYWRACPRAALTRIVEWPSRCQSPVWVTGTIADATSRPRQCRSLQATWNT